MAIKWSEEYLVGVEIIDEQHKKLFVIGNKAYELMKNEFYIDKFDRFMEIIDELKDYTIFHFQTEEDYMQQIGYKRLFTQKVEHQNFINKINSLNLREIDANQEQAILDILDFVATWIKNHILKVDKLITVD